MKRWCNRPEGSNWGDFGEDDQIGRLNLITAEIRLRAAREIRAGIAFQLSLPLDWPIGNSVADIRESPKLIASPWPGGGSLYNRRIHPGCVDIASDDAVLLYTQRSTQWDSFCHWGAMFDTNGDGLPEPVYYNGYRAGVDVLAPEEGGPTARALGIENIAATGVQGRGVLVNLFAACGFKREAIGYDRFMRILQEQNVTVETGDILCLYTGFTDLIVDADGKVSRETMDHACAVLDSHDARLLRWITDSGISAIVADNLGIEAWSPGADHGAERVLLPLHHLCLFKLGMPIGELWYLRELASWLRDHDRSRFFLTAPPLRLSGGVGSPVTPVATV
jgi:kynurenine formamidase